MAPPLYADLGKSARDLFNRGYNFGFLKLDTTTKAGTLEFKTGTSQNVATGKLFGSVDVKYKIPEYGVTLTERWNTDNNLGTEITVEDQLAKGMKLTFDSSFAPQLGKRTGKVKGEFMHQYIRVNGDVSMDMAGPVITMAACAGHEGWRLGYQTGYDSQHAKLTQSNFSFGRELPNYAVHTFINDGTEFGGSFYHRVSDKMEIGANLGWTSNEQTTRYGLAMKLQANKDTIVRAKLSNSSQVALAMTHTLNPSLKMTLSTLVNIHNFNEGGHKFGIGLEYEPAPLS